MQSFDKVMSCDLGKEQRILVVDDEAGNIDLLALLLEKEGYSQIVTTKDPRQVLSLFQEFQPDLLLLDLHMPHMDGFGVMQQLRPRIPEGEYFPILILTGDLNPTVKRQALALGAKDFLIKPFDRVEVLLRKFARNTVTAPATAETQRGAQPGDPRTNTGTVRHAVGGVAAPGPSGRISR